EEHINAPVPADMDMRQAPFSRLAAISMTAVQVSSFQPGDRVLVVGLGTIGNLAAQLFRESGARVACLDPSPSRRSIAQRTGLAAAFDPASEGDKLAGVVKALDGLPRLVIEAVGDATIAYQCVRHASRSRGGEVILLGS